MIKSNDFYFFDGRKLGWAGAAAHVLDVSKQPNACEGYGGSTDGHGRYWIAKVEQGHSDDKYSAHAVGDAVSDGGRGSEEGEGRVIVQKV